MPTPSEGTKAVVRTGTPRWPEKRRGMMAALFTMATAAPLLSGCLGARPRAAPVDPVRARETLHSALERWKMGDRIDALKTGSPPIVAQDFDWMAGHRLIAYEVSGEGRNDDANLRIPVMLTMRTAEGKKVKKSVSYVVGTSPSLTVFREFN